MTKKASASVIPKNKKSVPNHFLGSELQPSYFKQQTPRTRCDVELSKTIRVSRRGADGRHRRCSSHHCHAVWQGTVTVDQAAPSFSAHRQDMSSTSSSPSFSISSSSSSSSRCSDDGLQLGQVPLVHAVVAHQLVRAGKLLLTVGPVAGEGLLTWREGDKQRGKQRKSLL